MSLVTNQSGVEAGRQEYDAWGKVSSGGNVTQTKLNYTGQHKDDSGLHYYHARYYDSGVGRFNSADSIIPNLSDPQTLGRFTGMLNNPVNKIDLTVHEASISGDPAASWRGGLNQAVGTVVVHTCVMGVLLCCL